MFRTIRDWLRYERLHYYPAVYHLPREEALRRVRICEREVNDESRHWNYVIYVVIVLVILGYLRLLTIGSWLANTPIFIAVLIASYLLHYVRFLSIRKRVTDLLESERWETRPANCLRCGYNLRGGTTSTCSECGYHNSPKIFCG